MATIKDIAARLELSPSTVSIVLKGNGDKRKIKKETQHRILETARELGYKPNIQAKILRGSLSAKSNISLYQTPGFICFPAFGRDFRQQL